MSSTNNSSPAANKDFEFVLNAFLAAYRPVLERELELADSAARPGAGGAGPSADRGRRNQAGAVGVRTVLHHGGRHPAAAGRSGSALLGKPRLDGNGAIATFSVAWCSAGWCAAGPARSAGSAIICTNTGAACAPPSGQPVVRSADRRTEASTSRRWSASSAPPTRRRDRGAGPQGLLEYPIEIPERNRVRPDHLDRRRQRGQPGVRAPARCRVRGSAVRRRGRRLARQQGDRRSCTATASRRWNSAAAWPVRTR